LPLDTGVEVTGEITAPDTERSYQVQAGAAPGVLTLTPGNDTLSLRVHILASDGTKLLAVDGDPGQPVVIDLSGLPADTYQIRVAGHDGTTGPFTIVFTIPSDTPPAPEPEPPAPESSPS